jgi:hypothetical protein
LQTGPVMFFLLGQFATGPVNIAGASLQLAL